MGATSALIVATLSAFFVTWALHSYQWFWIRGRFPVVWQDIAFWSIMGLLVLGNMLYENKYGRQRSLARVHYSFTSELKLALRTIGTFVVVCTSWVIWSSESFGEFTMIAGRLLRADFADVLWIVGSLAALGVVAVVVARADRRKVGAAAVLKKQKARAPFWGGAYHVASSCAIILVVAYAPLVFNVNPGVFNVIDNLKSSRLNARDAQMLDRGYYEDLTDVVRFNTGLGDLYNRRPPDWDRCWAMHPVDGCPDYELQPNKRVLFKGAMMSTNRWGMRDRDCEKQTPPGTRRIAFLGASISMGTGVEDDEVFDNVAEDRLNQEHAATDGLRYEILNFSVGGYGPLQRLADFDRRVSDFEFDVLVCEGIDDLYWATKDIVDAARAGIPVPYPYIAELTREAGLTRETPFTEGMQRLKPRGEELVLWLYREMVERCRERGAVAVLACIPHTKETDPSMRDKVERQMALAREAGMKVIDMNGAYDGIEFSSIWITSWDSHPNALGHRLMADKFYQGIKAQGL
jgi:lysophospholipase L1-like esterase